MLLIPWFAIAHSVCSYHCAALSSSVSPTNRKQDCSLWKVRCHIWLVWSCLPFLLATINAALGFSQWCLSSVFRKDHVPQLESERGFASWAYGVAFCSFPNLFQIASELPCIREADFEKYVKKVFFGVHSKARPPQRAGRNFCRLLADSVHFWLPSRWEESSSGQPPLPWMRGA